RRIKCRAFCQFDNAAQSPWRHDSGRCARKRDPLASPAMETEGFVRLMETLAPPHLAESWDNVGVLIAPLRPVPIQRILLTIELTERVVAEAVAWGAEAVVAYHPPISVGLKRLVPTERSA